MNDEYTVGVAAEVSGVSVRTLHYYMDLAERLRQHTHTRFHDCGCETHRGMAEHYRANRRSGRNYDDMAPGLSQYIHDAILANCRRAIGSGV